MADSLEVEHCCYCVPDLKIATAIIAVLGIVTSPSVSWAVVRHTYVLRVACFLSTNTTKPDIVDVHFENVVSFGFGGNSGIGPSCVTNLNKNNKNNNNNNNTTLSEYSEKIFFRSIEETPKLIIVIKTFGWILLFFDILLVLSSLFVLCNIFRDIDRSTIKKFMFVIVFTIALSFIYALLYIAACVMVGGKFPVFELVFALSDLIMWCYFLLVLYSYSKADVL